MFKKILPILFMFSLGGCNYLSEEELEENSNSSLVNVSLPEGNAKKIITLAAKSRGYETNWLAKGNYTISEHNLSASMQYSFGQALVHFQELFTQNNLKLNYEIDLNSPGSQLFYPPYVLFFVCDKTLYVQEFTGDVYASNNRALMDGTVEGCQSADMVFLSKKEMETIERSKSQSLLPTTQNNDKQKKLPDKDIIYEDVDINGENVDINSIDFGSILLNKEFIESLEKESGQKLKNKE